MLFQTLSTRNLYLTKIQGHIAENVVAQYAMLMNALLAMLPLLQYGSLEDVDAVVSFEIFRALKLTLFESFWVLTFYDPI